MSLNRTKPNRTKLEYALLKIHEWIRDELEFAVNLTDRQEERLAQLRDLAADALEHPSLLEQDQIKSRYRTKYREGD